MAPSPEWALWIVPSDPSRWFFPCVCVVAANSCLTLCDSLNCSPPGFSVHEDSPGKNTGVDSRSLLQGILPISSGNFFTYMDSAVDLRGAPLQISGVLSASFFFSGILPCDHWLSWISKMNESSPSLCWKRSSRGCHHQLTPWAGLRLEEASSPLPGPWNVYSFHCPNSGSYFQGHSLERVECCWDHLDGIRDWTPLISVYKLLRFW